MALIDVTVTAIREPTAYNVTGNTVDTGQTARFKNNGRMLIAVYPDTPATPMTVTVASQQTVGDLAVEDRVYTTVNSSINLLPVLPVHVHNDINGYAYLTVSALCEIAVIEI